jgi:hypothetical protein
MIRRSRFLIEPGIQLQLIFLTVVVNLLGISVFALSLKIYFSNFISAAESKGLPKDHAFYQYLSMQETAMWNIFGYVVVVSFVVSLIFSLMYSHRLAGPLHRIRNELQKFSETKKWKPLELRKGDFFQEIVDLLNKSHAADEVSSKRKLTGTDGGSGQA